METNSFQYKMTLEDYYDFLDYHVFKKTSYRISHIITLICGILLLFMFIALWIADKPNIILLFLGLFFTFYLGVFQKIYRKQVKKEYDSNPYYQITYTYIIDDLGVKAESDVSTTTYFWDKLFKTVTTKKSLILYISKNQALVFPKEIISNYLDLSKFE